jgi:ribosomal protein S18 acetylase RimI-like enzyme
MSIEVKEVLSSSMLKTFIKFPFQLYSNNKYWVPPLIREEIKNFSRDKNPAFEFCESSLWLAFRNNKIVGRVAGIINRRYNEKVGKNIARFGYIDFIDDDEVSAKLFHCMENWANEKGCTSIHGPLGFTDMDPEGMLVEGFEELGTIATIYNFPYYPSHVEKLGYKKDIDWIEYELLTPKSIPDKVEKLAKAVAERYSLKVLEVNNQKQLLPYAHEIFHVLNSAYENIYGFVPLTESQIDLYVKQYFGFIKPGFVPVILNDKNEVVGFGITMPSLSKAFQKAKGKLFPFGFIHILIAIKKNKRADLYLTGVRPDYQDKGVNAMMMYEVTKVFREHRITWVESNPELETNMKVRSQWRFYEGRQHKRRRCYIKSLS